MEIKKIVVGALETNCYILKKGEFSLIIDPGCEASKIINEVGDTKVIGIIVTHNHFDHIGALDELKDYYRCSVYDKSNLEEKNYNLNSFNFDVIYTPGHTNDSITIHFNEEKTMFTGDFLFKNSIGRYDLPTGNYSELIKSLRKIKNYDTNIVIYPGHGPSSTLNEELIYNPFLSQL